MTEIEKLATMGKIADQWAQLAIELAIPPSEMTDFLIALTEKKIKDRTIQANRP